MSSIEPSQHINEVPKNRKIICIYATEHSSTPAVRKLIAAGYFVIKMKTA